MGLKEVRAQLVQALQTGNYQHEARGALSEKNLLAVGDLAPGDVIALLRRARGTDYSKTAHDWDRRVEVHLFRPQVSGQRWYVKAYFLPEAKRTAVFISVHRSEHVT